MRNIEEASRELDKELRERGVPISAVGIRRKAQELVVYLEKPARVPYEWQGYVVAVHITGKVLPA